MDNAFETDWTREEFKAYLLLYAARANFFEDESEKEAILTMVNPLTYKRIHKEIEDDNDYQSIQKILFNIEKHDYSKDKIKFLISDIERIFNASGKHDLLEENMLRGLQKLILPH
jgi:hypothetical protein